MQLRNARRVLVTGATGFLGFRVLVALLEAGADVTALAQPDRQDQLASLQDRITIATADVWNRASLKGRARGQGAIIHLVGSPRADPTRGLTHNQLNLVPARHVIGMAISDGVPYVVLLSAVMRPGDLSGEYIRSKRDAEDYLQNSGVDWTIVRAPALFAPGRASGLGIMSRLGRLFPLGLLLDRFLPLSVDTAARGLAGMALNPRPFINQTVYAAQLRRVARQSQFRRPLLGTFRLSDADPEGLNEPPFGWLPPR